MNVKSLNISHQNSHRKDGISTSLRVK